MKAWLEWWPPTMFRLFAGIAAMIVAIVVPVPVLCTLDYQCTLEVLTMPHTLVHMATTFAVTVIVASVFQKPVSQITEDKTKDEIRAKFKDEMKKALNHHVHRTINTAEEVAEFIEYLKERYTELYEKTIEQQLGYRELGAQRLFFVNQIKKLLELIDNERPRGSD